MAILHELIPATFFHLSTLLVTIPFISVVTYFLYNIFLHPLAPVPGPLLARLSPLWVFYHSYIGDEPSTIDAMHKRYGPVVRIAPNEIDIKDGAALAPIYTEHGGFLKAPYYRNFDIDGHQSIFSALDPSYRSVRSKAVVGMFAPGTIRKDGGEQVIEQGTAKLVRRMQAYKSSGEVLNMLNLARSLAVDAVTGYLFSQSYGGLDEAGTKRSDHQDLSASAFVDTFVAVGRFFLLPNWFFVRLEMVSGRLFPDPKVDKSMGLVSSFTDRLVEEATEDDATYQGRLLKAGITRHEVSAQCKDLMFAGTDSTGTSLTTICWHLNRNPDVYSRLQDEVTGNPDAPAESLPYLRAVVKEGLRLALANPTRLPRAVPPSGFAFGGYHFPRGTNVGCSPYSLHFNSEVYQNPLIFKPERWLEGNVTPEMQRDHIPFGLGARQCIARNLATAELHIATRRIAESDVLSGSKNCGRCAEKIELDEWFNSKVVGHAIEMQWSAQS